MRNIACTIVAAVVLTVLCPLSLLPATAQTGGDVDDEKLVGAELVHTQRRIKKQFQNLTLRMLEVADLLDEGEPAAAKAIREAVYKANNADVEGHWV